jgi:uncharacterized protein (TIGR02996 family)
VVEAELIRRVLDAPDDPEPRLVLCDWLAARPRPPAPTTDGVLSHHAYTLCCACGRALTHPLRLLDRGWTRRLPGHDYGWRGYPHPALPEGLGWLLPARAVADFGGAAVPADAELPADHPIRRENRFWSFLRPDDWLVSPRSVLPDPWTELDLSGPDAEGCCRGFLSYLRPNLRCGCGLLVGRCWTDCPVSDHAQLLRERVQLVRAPWPAPAFRVIGALPIQSVADLRAELRIRHVREIVPLDLPVLWLNADVSVDRLPHFDQIVARFGVEDPTWLVRAT